MADRKVHYEAAFEGFLRDRKTPYVAVDEAKKALFAGSNLKSFDFVVYASGKPNLLVDVKGRQARGTTNRRSYETWCTERDVDDLIQWQQVFGEGFQGLLAFTYWIETPLIPDEGMFEFRDRWYLMMGVDLSEYRAHMRRRSAKWATVCLSAEDYRLLARPLVTWL